MKRRLKVFFLWGDMSYSGRKLKFFVENFQNNLEESQRVAEKLCLAEDDGELSELPSLLHPKHSFFHNSFWGLARGPVAAQAVLTAEKKYFVYAWTTPLEPVTSRTFVRRGYIRVLPEGRQLQRKADHLHGRGSSGSSTEDNCSAGWYSPTKSAGQLLDWIGDFGSTMLSWTPITLTSSFFSYFWQRKISEYIVVKDGKVVYRDVGYDWYMAKQ